MTACAADMTFTKVADHLEATFGPERLPYRSAETDAADEGPDDSDSPAENMTQRTEEAYAVYTQARRV